ncbi:MAG: type II/IV secretion system protein [Candidatus Peribacteraceae bacterium]|nr:type II/IV secretion system protein [Candidatus Peribacteraceae bacterium]
MITWETPIDDIQSLDWQSLDGEELLKTLEIVCVKKGISDIHISPEREDVRLEVRLHNVLIEIARTKHDEYIKLVRRVKFQAKMKLNVTNIPQDGQYIFEAPERLVNVRIASIPSKFGETYTLRLLDPKKGIVELHDLGFPELISNTLKEITQLHHGLILVTGPTGSGKTTTLYSLLNTLVGKERNIITIEDPIEYELKGIVQSEVDNDHGYNFASGLRSILRHDPDVILVGEIRDEETANTAVNAALTGHLVLSTLHTNSAIEAINRLLSMGVHPQTLAPALQCILSQRLVRTISDECKKEGAKCDPADHNTYCGVTALSELLVVTNTLKEKIVENASSKELEETAFKEGYMNIEEWGAKLIKDGITNKTEIKRIAS